MGPEPGDLSRFDRIVREKLLFARFSFVLACNPVIPRAGNSIALDAAWGGSEDRLQLLQLPPNLHFLHC
jgi:hypothetical protein